MWEPFELLPDTAYQLQKHSPRGDFLLLKKAYFVQGFPFGVGLTPKVILVAHTENLTSYLDQGMSFSRSSLGEIHLDSRLSWS